MSNKTIIISIISVIIIILSAGVVYGLEIRKQYNSTNSSIDSLTKSLELIDTKLSKMALENNQLENTTKPIRNTADTASIISTPTLTQNIANSDSKNSTFTNSNMETYINPMFPGMKIIYPQGWKVEKQPFNKDNSSILISLVRVYDDKSKPSDMIDLNFSVKNDCNKFTESDPEKPSKISITNLKQFSNSIWKSSIDLINTENNYSRKYIHYGDKVSQTQYPCFKALEIKTVINPSALTQNELSFPTETLKTYLNINIGKSSAMGTLKGVDPQDQTISEIDQIISQSTFN